MKFLLILLSLIPLFSLGQKGDANQSIFCSSVQFITNVNSGSGIFIKQSNYIFFATARHILFDYIKKEDTVLTFLPSLGNLRYYAHDIVTDEPTVMVIDLKKAYNDKMIKYSENHDIAVIAVGYYLNTKDSIGIVKYYDFIDKNKVSFIHPIGSDMMTNYNEVALSDDVIIFGYPTSIGLKGNPQFDNERPLLRKGIVAGKYEKQKTIIIDCPSYFGNSGGPVWKFYIEGLTTYAKLIGINSQYIPYVDVWVNEQKGIKNIENSNSDYSVVVPIEFAIELMNKFLIKK